MTPIEFRQQIRLQAARVLLHARASNVAEVGYRVGYESPSQFSREYRRLFGAPPQRDVSRMRLAPVGGDSNPRQTLARSAARARVPSRQSSPPSLVSR